MFSKPPGRSGKALSKLRNRMNMEYLRRDGSASMYGPLYVRMADAYTGISSETYDSGAAFPGFYLLKSDSDTLGTLAETDTADVLGYFAWQGVNSSSAAATAAYISAVQNGAAGATYVPADIVFATGTDAAAAAERMRITTDGYVTVQKVWHAYGGFEGQGETIACGAGDWNHITNAGNTLWNLDETDGITEASDAFTIVNAGDYAGTLSLSFSSLNAKDFHVRVYNVT